MKPTKKFHLHLISDSTGETVSSVSRSVLSQFENIDPEEHLWSLVRTRGHMEKVLEGIAENPGFVIYTLVNEELQEQIINGCNKIGVPCLSVLTRIIREISTYLDVKISDKPGRQYALDEDYFTRIEAINFALAHDDGQRTDELEEADIVLLGPSRTSKTPTCVYLSYRGFYAANVPIVKGVPLPEKVFNLKNPLVVGLIISPERLIQIRKSRLQSISEEKESSYVDMERVKEEVIEAQRLFQKQKWHVLDVTRSSIEETVAKIINMHREHRKRKEAK